MKIIIPGGRGQVGRMLKRDLMEAGHDVVIFSRKADAAEGIVAWDGKNLGDWASHIDGADAVINLTGRTVNCRYNEANLKEMMDSRVHSARVVGEAISQAANPPKVWLQASTATIYAHNFGEPWQEDGELGGNEPNVPAYWSRSTDIAKAWEAVTMQADTPNTRKVLLRSSYIMSADAGGIFDMLMWLLRRGLGGPVVGGEQYISWIHERDLARAILLIIEDDSFEGPVNLAAPHPLSQADAMRAIREAYGMSWYVPVSHWMAVVGAIYLRTDIELIVKSRRVVSQKLADAGFVFEFDRWPEAAKELVSRWPIAA